MPGGYGIGAKGTGQCSEMSLSRHLMSQRFITVPRGYVTVRLGTTSWGAESASLGCLLYLTGSAAVFIPVPHTFLSTYRFFLQVFAPSYSSVLVLWNLLYWPPFLFQTLHNFSLKPPTPQQNKCIDTSFHHLWRDDLPFVQPLNFDDIVFASEQWSSVLYRLRHAGALLAGLTLKGWCLLPASSEDIHKSLSGISHRKSSVY